MRELLKMQTMKRLGSPLLDCITMSLSLRAQDLPEGVRVEVSPTDDVVVILDADKAVTIRQAEAAGRTVAVGNQNGALQIVQLEEGGKMPVGVDLLSADKAKITIMRGETPSLVIDEDGDGIPDRKIDRTGRYRLGKIEWEKGSRHVQGGRIRVDGADERFMDYRFEGDTLILSEPGDVFRFHRTGRTP